MTTNQTSKDHKVLIAELAAQSFANHVLTWEPGGYWRCGRANSIVYSFQIFFAPGAVMVWGDMGEFTLCHYDKDSLGWLLLAAKDDGYPDYFLGKLQAMKGAKEEFSYGDAMAHLDHDEKECGIRENFSGVERVLRVRAAMEEVETEQAEAQSHAWWEAWGENGDSDPPGCLGWSSGALWLWEMALCFRRLHAAILEQEIAAWNAAHPTGTIVYVGGGASQRTSTTGPAVASAAAVAVVPCWATAGSFGERDAPIPVELRHLTIAPAEHVFISADTYPTLRKATGEMVRLVETPPESVMDVARFAQAPCYLCGYNGGGYYQPATHPCAERYHAAEKAPAAGVMDVVAVDHWRIVRQWALCGVEPIRHVDQTEMQRAALAWLMATPTEVPAPEPAGVMDVVAVQAIGARMQLEAIKTGSGNVRLEPALPPGVAHVFTKADGMYVQRLTGEILRLEEVGEHEMVVNRHQMQTLLERFADLAYEANRVTLANPDPTFHGNVGVEDSKGGVWVHDPTAMHPCDYACGAVHIERTATKISAALVGNATIEFTRDQDEDEGPEVAAEASDDPDPTKR